jgi:hypothetical protein
MERGSNKHTPVVDDRMKEEAEPLERGAPTSGRVEEYREIEPTGDEKTVARDDVEMRSLIARWLHRVDFPATRGVLIDEARQNNAPAEVLEALESLPDVTTYENAQQIWVALGGEPEERF